MRLEVSSFIINKVNTTKTIDHLPKIKRTKPANINNTVPVSKTAEAAGICKKGTSLNIPRLNKDTMVSN